MGIPDIWPFIHGATIFSMQFDNDANGNQIYVGWAQPGSATSDVAWRIMHQTFDASNNVLTITWPSASTSFSFQWTLRTGYTYS